MSEWRCEIDKGSPSPIYQQLKEIIKGKIERGEFAPGARIPTEYELCDQFAISRAPVRQALAELVNEGFLYRQQGSGTFVNHNLGERAVSLRAIITEDLWIHPLRKAVSLYNREQKSPRVTLKVETLGRPQLHAKILSAVGRGDAPDLALIDWAWVSEFANLHFLKRLDTLDREWTEAFKADLFPAFVDRSAPVLYGIQPEANVSVIWYRKDWFAAEHQTPPRTWEELVEVAQHFKRFNRFPLAFVGGRQAGETTTYQLLPFLWAAGGGLFSQGRVALDDRAVYTLRFLSDLVHKYRVTSPECVSFAWDQPARLFAGGEAAVAVGGSYEKPLIQEVSGWDEETFRERVGCISIPAVRDDCYTVPPAHSFQILDIVEGDQRSTAVGGKEILKKELEDVIPTEHQDILIDSQFLDKKMDRSDGPQLLFLRSCLLDHDLHPAVSLLLPGHKLGGEPTVGGDDRAIRQWV